MKNTLLLTATAALSFVLSSCSLWESTGLGRSPASSVDATISRYISSLDLERSPTSLVYYTYEKNEAVQVDVNRWRTLRKAANSRWDLFSKAFYANTRSKSNSGLRHVACFTGSSTEFVQDFFSKDPKNEIAHVDQKSLSVTESSNGRMVGISFNVRDNVTAKEAAHLKGRSWHFRIAHCTQSGKMPILDDNVIVLGSLEEMSSTRMPSAEPELPEVPLTEDGFKIFDQPNFAGKNLPQFQFSGDYEKMQVRDTDRPWKDLDVSTLEGAEKFALVMQKYIYEGMFNQGTDADVSFIPSKNTVRDWCHMPWLNVGESGREGIHGLTKERDLYPSSIYPNPTEGSNWGIGFYNAVGCKTLGKVFGAESSRRDIPNFASGNTIFADGTVSAKILFTTAKFAEIEDAFVWNANVSSPKSTLRKIQAVRHIQMDIAVKDSSIKGSWGDVDNWVMITYYYNKKYTSPLTIAGMPEALKHMQPQGIQVAFSAEGSTIFPGALTNNYQGLLNGPADNTKGSCLGCHGTAGTKHKMVPGFEKETDFLEVRGKHLDFSQQLAYAKSNFETRSKARVVPTRRR